MFDRPFAWMWWKLSGLISFMFFVVRVWIEALLWPLLFKLVMTFLTYHVIVDNAGWSSLFIWGGIIHPLLFVFITEQMKDSIELALYDYRVWQGKRFHLRTIFQYRFFKPEVFSRRST